MNMTNNTQQSFQQIQTPYNTTSYGNTTDGNELSFGVSYYTHIYCSAFA